MKVCPKCQASVSDTAKFCVKCGFNIKKFEEENAARECFCPECGTKFSGGTFCPECGYDVSGDLAGTESGSIAVASAPSAPSLVFNAGLDFDAMNEEAQNQLYEKEGFAVEGGVLTGYTGKKRMITIPGTVDEIYDGAFEGNAVISHVEIAEGVSLIGKRAFADCSTLTKLSIPTSVKKVFDDALVGTHLETLVLPELDVSLVKQCISNAARVYFDFSNVEEYVTRENGKVTIDVEGINKDHYKRLDKGTFVFGSYYQSNEETKDPIEWIVLAKGEKQVHLLSKHALAWRPMDRVKWQGNYLCRDWEKGTLFRWLHGEFLDSAFDGGQRQLIDFDSAGVGVNLLSKYYVSKYPQVRSFCCLLTPYAAKAAGFSTTSFVPWWLSSKSYSDGEDRPDYMSDVGKIQNVPATSACGVRPAIWIKLEI